MPDCIQTLVILRSQTIVIDRYKLTKDKMNGSTPSPNYGETHSTQVDSEMAYMVAICEYDIVATAEIR